MALVIKVMNKIEIIPALSKLVGRGAGTLSTQGII